MSKEDTSVPISVNDRKCRIAAWMVNMGKRDRHPSREVTAAFSKHYRINMGVWKLVGLLEATT